MKSPRVRPAILIAALAAFDAFVFFLFHERHVSGFDPASFGFPSYLGANSLYPQLPTLTFATTQTNLTTLGFGSNALRGSA